METCAHTHTHTHSPHGCSFCTPGVEGSAILQARKVTRLPYAVRAVPKCAHDCDRLSACGAGLGKPSARKGCPLQPLSKAWQCPIRSYSVHTHTQRLLRRPVDRLKNCTRRQDGVESGNDPRRPCSTSEQALSGEVESRSQFSEILEVSHRSTEPCTHASKIADGRNQIRASPWRTGLFLPRTLYRNVLLQDGIRRS